MNIRIKTVLILTLLFVIMALFWGIIGRSFINTSIENMDNSEIVFNSSTAIVIVDDINSTINYYRNVFGFELQRAIPESGVYDFALLNYGDAELMLYTRSTLPEEYTDNLNNEFSVPVILYFDIKNLDAYYKSLRDKCEIVIDIFETGYGTKEFSVRDNNGYMLIFGENITN